MDRSFLSKPEVIAASRQFVCVRLATYEDESENKFLKTFNVGRGGEVENSVFCILGPDGKQRLCRAARGISQVFADCDQMAAAMDKIATTIKPKSAPKTLPLAANVRLAIDIASSDNQPLVIVVAKDAKQREALESKLAAIAWSPTFVGRAIYVSANSTAELVGVNGVTLDAGIALVQTDKFGLKANMLKQIPATASDDKLAESLRLGMLSFEAQAKTFRSHVQEGHKQGIFWETKLPVTDVQEKSARERGRQKVPPQ